MLHFDPFDYRTHEDPYPIYRRLRDEAPAYFNPEHGFWVLSRYEDCLQALRDFRSFSNAGGITLEPTQGQLPIVLTVDPPDHTRLRHILSAAFTPEAVAPMEEDIRTLARALLAPHQASGRLDLIADFAARLPMAIICRLLGVPREHEDMLRGWTDDAVHRDEGVFEMPEKGIQATLQLYGYFDAMLQARRASAPLDDLTGRIDAAERAGTLSREEALGYLYLLSIAGNETTTKLIGNLCYQLSRHPEQRQWLLDDPALIPAAIEETMRFDGPTQMQARTLTRDVELHGQTLKAGQKVGILFISANRDERRYARADQFDILRHPRDHLGFGAGLHACIGAALARLEARIALEEILRLMPDFEVVESGLARMHSPNVRGFTQVPVRFSPRG